MNLSQRVAALEQQLKQLQQALTDVTHRRESFGDLATPPPLDSPVLWKRGQSTDLNGTHEILSLVHEVTAKKSYPWPLFVQLKTLHDEGDGVGVCVNLIKGGAGWGSAYHADTFHSGTGT